MTPGCRMKIPHGVMQTEKKKKRQKIGVTQFKGKRILCVLRAVVVGAEDMGVVDLADFIKSFQTLSLYPEIKRGTWNI